VPTKPLENGTVHKRWITTVVVLAVAFPVALLVLGQTSHPELGLVLIAVTFPTLFVVGRLRNRRTREGTDERARANHRRATSFGWYVITLTLTAVIGWMWLRHGRLAAEPYVSLLTVSVVGYVGALLWRQWRGV
jgi:hypothetical protein